MLRAAGCSAAGATAIVASGYSYCKTYHEREADFWRKMLVPVVHYRILDRVARNWSDRDRDTAFAPLHEKYVPRVESLLWEQRGLYIKLAQFIGNRSDVVPKAYMKLCERFQDECPLSPITGDALKQFVAESLGVTSLDEIYREFDATPFSSASIGQVHRAVLLDGTRVAVKVQHPDAENIFRRDLKTQQNLCRFAAPVHLPALSEIEKQFKTEFDYRLEAENLDLIRNNIMPVFGNRVVVPKPYNEYTSKDVLTMEFLEGEKMTTRLRKQLDSLASESGKTREEIMEEIRQRPPLTHGDIRKYNFARTCKWLVDCAWRFSFNTVTLSGLLANRMPYRGKPGPLLDIPTLMDLLIEVHGHEMLIDGAFNGDPHAGNILICPDGKLGLIDYGQVKRLSDEKRKKLARIFCALVEEDSAGIAKVCRDTNMVITTHMDKQPELLHQRLDVQLNYDDLTTTRNMNVQVFLEEIDDDDPLKHVDDDIIMPVRLSFMMRGMGFALQYPVRTAERWYPLAKRALAS